MTGGDGEGGDVVGWPISSRLVAFLMLRGWLCASAVSCKLWL